MAGQNHTALLHPDLNARADFLEQGGWCRGAPLRDGWPETRVTFGWVGFGIILLMLDIVLARWRWGGGMPVSWEFTALI